MSGLGNTVTSVSATGNSIIDGLLYGSAWNGPITYAFPDTGADYSYQKEAQSEFAEASSQQVVATLFALEQSSGTAADDGFSVEGFTNAELDLGAADTATLRVAQSDVPRTSYTYMPGDIAQAGDMWLGKHFDYTTAQAGNYAWHTIMHEIGHSLGLKHGNEAANGFAALPAEYDALEYSIMTYRTYEGGNTNGYTYTHWSAPQTYMMADIAALQHMYGADFTTNSGNTTYKWTQASGDTYVDGKLAIDAGGTVIFATIWDGGGIDTYDLSTYTTNLHIDLQPGASSTFSDDQLAALGKKHSASGSIYNALQYENDVRSLIENAIGGSGNDVMGGNLADNMLNGNSGNDRLLGKAGADHLIGGGGMDRLFGGAGDDALYGGQETDRLWGGDGNDTLYGGQGADVFCFKSGGGFDTIADFQDGSDTLSLHSYGFTTARQAIAHATQAGSDVVMTFDDASTLTIRDFDLGHLSAADFSCAN